VKLQTDHLFETKARGHLQLCEHLMGALQLLDYAEFVQQFFKRALVLVALE